MPKVLPLPPIPEVPMEQLLEGFDEQKLTDATRHFQLYERELKQRRSGHTLFISLKACQDLQRSVREWTKMTEIVDRLRQLRNKPEHEQEPYKHLIALVTEAQYALAEIFTDATTPYDAAEYFHPDAGGATKEPARTEGRSDAEQKLIEELRRFS